MAKAKRHFVGTCTFGSSVERAQREDGVWFHRWQEKTDRYGYVWTKWQQCDEPRFETHGTNAYTDERFEYQEPKMFWGFQMMRELSGPHRIRLPN